MRWTYEQYREYQNRLQEYKDRLQETLIIPVDKTDRYRSNTEREYADLLRVDPTIRQWWYEPFKLWLAPQTTITIDFLVHYKDDRRLLELHEVKGRWVREDGWVKLKIAASLYPCFRVVQAQCIRHEWVWTYLPHTNRQL